MSFVLPFTSLMISFALAYFFGLRVRRFIPKGKEFIGLVCSIGILITFFMTKDIFFSPYKNSLFNAIGFGLAYGLAFGIGNRHSKVR